ncbi:substrate-binding domain-containing protein [Candidatus Merdisoma sp. JLR.KK011]|uniref:substrate-binding domain-containing protein n=1 Tax=Candidatus Merdisoma sp. JLR.KK011 TaxID=3114299 RepID=UPI002FF069DA
MKRKLLSMVLAFVLVFAAGCGKSGGEGAAEPADNAPAAEGAEAEAPEESGTEDAAGESFSVGFALRTANGSYYAAIGEVVKAKCEELGWECTILDANNDTTKELENMESLAASGVDLIFLDCVDPSAATASQKVAADAGIPLINLDSGVDDMSMQITTVYSNNEQNGLEVGKYYAAALADDFEISAVMLSGNTGSIAGTQRRDGMFAGIIMERTGCTEEEAWTAAEEMEASLVSTGKASNADAKFTITGQGWGNWTIDEGLIAAEDLITANPSLNLIMGENDPMLIGALTALDNAGITYGAEGTVQLISAADGSKDGYDRVKAGDIMAIGENSPSKIGELGVEIAKDILVNGASPDSYEDITMTEAVAVTADNVEERYEFGF